MYENYDLETIVTPVNADILEEMLIDTEYDEEQTRKIVNGFRFGFPLGYEGQKTDIRRRSPNLKLRIGDKIDLWNKVMKEVKCKRYAGPFKEIPFRDYIQSPIGLVPKDHGKDTRLIFHLSYPRNGHSVNSDTPEHLCKVKYPDFNEAVMRCLEELQILQKCGEDKERSTSVSGSERFEYVTTAKSDLKSAFRILPLRICDVKFLIMMAENPKDNITYFFVDKNLPFGASISCKHFQDFSNCLAHIQKIKSGKRPINYLDDFFFAAWLRSLCDDQVRVFLDICNKIGFPVSLEKTVWSTTVIVFLGLMIDTEKCLICIPLDKIHKAVELIGQILNSKKIQVFQLQKLCGFLNFLGKCIIPGRAFTRRLYAPTAGKVMKPHYHLRVNMEMKMDLTIWQAVLNNQNIFCRPFMDFSKCWHADDLDWYTDSSKNPNLGMGGYFKNLWFSQKWDSQFIIDANPSIQYLELFAVTTAIMAWIHLIPNRRVVIFTDNDSVKNMINNSTSGCKNCMVLIRLIVMKGIVYNTRIFAKHVPTKSNKLADLLSRMKIKQFWKEIQKRNKPMNDQKIDIPKEVWPMRSIWMS